MSGVELIAAERERQMSQEEWTPEHDDGHSRGELALAAMCYVAPEGSRYIRIPEHTPSGWPWGRKWWKPTPKDRIRELKKAGALIAAEIDRLQRAAQPGGKGKSPCQTCKQLFQI